MRLILFLLGLIAAYRVARSAPVNDPTVELDLDAPIDLWPVDDAVAEHGWIDFVQAHGQIIGYDMGKMFLPVPPGNARAIRVHEETAARLGRDPGLPVYGPRSEPPEMGA
jgi:hypothetical protein